MSTLTIEEFNESCKNKDFLDYYQKFQETLDNLQKIKSPLLLEYYQEYCEKLPFNFMYWEAYAQLQATILGGQTGKEEGLKIYEKSVKKNPFSVQLWTGFISWLQKEYSDNQQLILSHLDTAIECVGLDYYSSGLWKQLLALNNSDAEKHLQLLYKITNQPINELDEFYTNFYNQLETLSEQQLQKFYQQCKNNSENSASATKELIITEFQQQEKKNKQVSNARQQFEKQLQQIQFDEKTSNAEWKIWSQYLEQSSGKSYYLQTLKKCLLTNFQRHQLWIQYFDKLESDESVLQFFDLNYYFFLRLGGQTIYYILDIYEKVNPQKAEEIFQQLLQLKYNQNVGFYTRYMQTLIRLQNDQQLQELFGQMKKQFKSQMDIYVWVIKEQVKYHVLNQKDIQKAQNQLEAALTETNYHYYIVSFYINFILSHLSDKIQGNVIELFKQICYHNKLTDEIQNYAIFQLRDNSSLPFADIVKMEQQIRQIAQESKEYINQQKTVKGKQGETSQ